MLNKLLGVKRSSKIDAKYQKCRQKIRSLREQIGRKLDEKDDETLSKFNDMYGALLHYEASDEYESKYSADQPSNTPIDIPHELRPMHHFPLDPSHKAKFALQRSLKGHNDKIYAMRWSSDSNHVVSASKDGTLVVWDMARTFNKKVGIPLRTSWVMSVDYSPNGQYIASGGLDNMCSVFNVANEIGWAPNRPHRELQQHEGYVASCRFVDNEHILSASGDSTCILWDIEYQHPIALYCGHNGDVESVAHNKESNHTFISGSIDMNAKLWDYRLKSHSACIKTFTGHQSDINSVQWFPDYKSFGTASDDGCCRLFDISSYQTMNVYGNKLKESNQVTGIDFSKSGYYLVASYDDGPLCVAWNTVTTKVEKVLPHASRVSCLEFEPNGRCIVTASWDKQLRIWA